MLVLTFRIGEYVYGLEARSVAEVVPPTVCKELPRSPDYVKGLFNYRGMVTPVVDLSMLAMDVPCISRMSTRIVIIDLADLDDGAERGKQYLGLLAENITETLKITDSDFEDSGLEIPDAPWLGRVARINDCMLQLLKPHKLLSEELRQVLFPKDDSGSVQE
ncbi:chemotaxis protein CheW [Maridesulfovibrio salexigens]|uniref:CheW protein n=1 Tax=Maridesulfovibrio salexigens (strain ATCC 14822 / DSM 2638 / NCIMB 8403 / VKM B-1763) TaxID=526222 RepID=C6BU39_MARSD|nr:chemotaxis protein CheW [Maridesulfovibrio salexigens]ACS81748.1 CheW protein [Maridesulfovibrio salexigens DSM 2638]